MARASELFGANDDFTIPADASHASGSGWLVDPVLNTGGVIIYTFSGFADSAVHAGFIGADKVDPTANAKIWADVNGGVSFSNLKLAPGIGLYVPETGNYLLFKYL